MEALTCCEVFNHSLQRGFEGRRFCDFSACFTKQAVANSVFWVQTGNKLTPPLGLSKAQAVPVLAKTAFFAVLLLLLPGLGNGCGFRVV